MFIYYIFFGIYLKFQGEWYILVTWLENEPIQTCISPWNKWSSMSVFPDSYPLKNTIWHLEGLACVECRVCFGGIAMVESGTNIKEKKLAGG